MSQEQGIQRDWLFLLFPTGRETLQQFRELTEHRLEQIPTFPSVCKALTHQYLQPHPLESSQPQTP